MNKKTKSKLSKKYVTEGELLKDMRDQLIVELPKLTKKRAFWTLMPYMAMLGFASLCFIDFTRPAKKADLLIGPGTEITLVQMPQPNWNEYGLTPSPDYWRIPNPVGRSAHLFDVTLTARTLPYKKSMIRALAQDLAGEARLELLEAPLIVQHPTVLFMTPVAIDDEDLPVRAAVIRTCALKIADKEIPLHTFVDPHIHHGKLIVEIAPDRGQPRFEENLSMAFTRVVRFVTGLFDKPTKK